MNSVVNFLLESGISLSLLSIIYLIFLRKETFFRTNRIFLLLSVVFSLVLPLLHIPVFAPQSNMIEEIKVTPYQNLLETVIVSSQGFSETVETAVISSTLIVWAYLAGLVIFISLFLYRMIQLGFIIKKSEVVKTNSYKLVVVQLPMSPFAFINYIFVSHKFREMPGHERMMLHEIEHVKQGHTFDVLILEVLTIFQWFNPFMWLLRRAIRENHEYLADKAVLSVGIKPSEYKELLLSQYIGGPVMATSHFNYSLIRNRIKMMARIESSKLSVAKFLLGIVLAVVLVVVFACEQQISSTWDMPPKRETLTASFSNDTLSLSGSAEDLQKVVELVNSGNYKGTYLSEEGRAVVIKSEDKDERIRIITEILDSYEKKIEPKTARIPDPVKENIVPPLNENVQPENQVFYIVEDMPEFPGGEAALRNHIAKSIRYPQLAQERAIQGRVYVQFIVSADGSVRNANIARGVDPLLDQEALRVVRDLPLWMPGKQRGKAVDVSYTVPINFVLQ
jgi:TonB family protein